MARVTGEKWLINGIVLKVYDEAECPICASVDDLSEGASFHQGNMIFPECSRHWSVLTCHRCKTQYVYRNEYDERNKPG